MRICKNPSCKAKHSQKWIPNVCSTDCGYALSKINLKKKRDKDFTELKRKHRKTDLTIRKEAAKRICHEYIRTRDKFKPCICCGRELGNNYQAGHWLPSGQNPKVRYNEYNIHAQRLDCNYYRGGDSGDYEANLIERIGIDRVNALKAQKGGTVKRTADDYREIENYFKAKLKLITK